MFATLKAIEVLVQTDTKASDAEKNRVLEVLRHADRNEMTEKAPEACVVSFEYARHVLGYDSKASVYKAVRDGLLKPFYGGKGRKRATGVILESLKGAVAV